MSDLAKNRGGAPVGFLAELDSVEAASVIYFRLWCDGPKSQACVWNDFATTLGATQGRETLCAFKDLCAALRQYGRRPLMRHAVECNCLGADEACFANFVGAAAEGNNEEAMMIASLMVRPDVAPLVCTLASEVGIAFKRMKLCAPRDMRAETHVLRPPNAVLH